MLARGSGLEPHSGISEGYGREGTDFSQRGVGTTLLHASPERQWPISSLFISSSSLLQGANHSVSHVLSLLLLAPRSLQLPQRIASRIVLPLPPPPTRSLQPPFPSPPLHLHSPHASLRAGQLPRSPSLRRLRQAGVRNGDDALRRDAAQRAGRGGDAESDPPAHNHDPRSA